MFSVKSIRLKSALGHSVVNIANSQQAPSNSPPGKQLGSLESPKVYLILRNHFRKKPNSTSSTKSSSPSSRHSHQLQAAESELRVVNRQKKNRDHVVIINTVILKGVLMVL